MKIHNLLCYTKIILETDEDMFPGISSSAFDEHRKSEQAPLGVADIERKLAQLESLDDLLTARADKLARQFHVRNVFEDEPPLPNEKLLIDMPWIDKYPYTKRKLEASVVDITSPHFKNLEHIVAAYELSIRQHSRYTIESRRLSRLLRSTKIKELE